MKLGIHRSVKNLVQKIEEFIQHFKKNLKPFKWAKTSKGILAIAKRSAYAVYKSIVLRCKTLGLNFQNNHF
jgi:hypothetical protein